MPPEETQFFGQETFQAGESLEVKRHIEYNAAILRENVARIPSIVFSAGQNGMSGRSQSIGTADVSTYDPRTPREFWLDAESVMCACPDCQAPISIRLWLLVADCWQCGCSIELTAEQEQRIHSLLRRQQERSGGGQTRRPDVGREAETARRLPLPGHQSNRGAPSKTRQQNPPRERQQSTVHPLRRSALPPTRLQHLAKRRSLREWLNQMPAWLISMLLHMALLALLALLMFEGDAEEDPYITLSTETNRLSQTGGDVTIQDPDATFHFDLPVPAKDAPQTLQQRKAMARANQDAKQLRVDPTASLPQLPTLEQVKQQLRSTNSSERALAARDPRVRVELVSKEGGTTLTEAAVARGLRWMAQHQNRDGSWSLHRFSRTAVCRGRCRGHGTVSSDSAATSLCLLPFLGAGQTHQTGIYKDTVAKGLRWLLNHQLKNGDLRAQSSGNSGMYAHGQGAIVLCEAYALTRDEQLREAAQDSIDFIVNAQHSGGGWRYQPGDKGDTSVLGWQLMALQSARAAQLEVPEVSLQLAGVYLDSVEYDDGSRYAYQPNRRPTHVMTAEALLCRMYLGWSKEFAGLDQGVKYLIREHMPESDETNFYYWYYATQVLHHFGGTRWKKWNLAMRDILVRSQQRRGHEAGSWDPKGGHASQGGRLYSTALAVCTLEVYYRHAPIFRQLALD